jgi:hypothetical protein
MEIYINDTFEIQNENHRLIVDKYIPLDMNLLSNKNNYDQCQIRTLFPNEPENNLTVNKCNEWVFSREYFDHTIVTDVRIFLRISLKNKLKILFNIRKFYFKWKLVCSQKPKKAVFSTLFFIGTYSVLLIGILSDRY